jgi:hypothetical protein
MIYVDIKDFLKNEICHALTSFPQRRVRTSGLGIRVRAGVRLRVRVGFKLPEFKIPIRKCDPTLDPSFKKSPHTVVR